MTRPRSYQVFCPVGAALNAVGDRWALLVVRDLMLGPRRYSELLRGLGGVGTDILAARLRALEQDGIIHRRGEGKTQSYQLSEAGQALRPVLVELARWGAQRLQLPGDPAEVPARVPLTAVLIGAPPLPRRANGTYRIVVAEETIGIEVADGQVRPAPEAVPTTTITLTMAGLRSLIAGAGAPELESGGELRIEGKRRQAEALLGGLAGPPLFDGLRSLISHAAPAHHA